MYYYLSKTNQRYDLFFKTLILQKAGPNVWPLLRVCIFWTSLYGLVTARPPTEDTTEGQTTVVLSPTQTQNTFTYYFNKLYFL